jgi:hypothetical protein
MRQPKLSDRVCALILLTLVSGGLFAESDDNAVEFKAEPARAGTALRLSTEISVNVFGKNTQSLFIRKLRQSWVLQEQQGVASKIKVAYGDMQTKSSIDGVKGQKPPVANKTYLITTQGPAITTLSGGKISEAEATFIKNDFIAMGNPHPIATMLYGQRIKMGEEVGSTDVLKSLIEEHLTEVGVGEVKNLSVRLIARQRYKKLNTAVFWMNIEAGSSKLFPDSSAKFTGQLVVAIPSGLPLAFKLDGALNVVLDLDHDSVKSSTSRGTLSVVMIGDLDLPPADRRNEDDDNDVFIYDGRRMQVRR